jgi:hypothetical protein
MLRRIAPAALAPQRRDRLRGADQLAEKSERVLSTRPARPSLGSGVRALDKKDPTAAYAPGGGRRRRKRHGRDFRRTASTCSLIGQPGRRRAGAGAERVAGEREPLRPARWPPTGRAEQSLATTPRLNSSAGRGNAARRAQACVPPLRRGTAVSSPNTAMPRCGRTGPTEGGHARRGRAVLGLLRQPSMGRVAAV